MASDVISAMRVSFGVVAKWRRSWGEWSEADQAAFSADIKAAIDSKDEKRIKGLADWLQGMATEVIAADAQMRTRVREANARISASIQEERAKRGGNGSARREAAPVQAVRGVVVRDASRHVGGAANAARGVAGVGQVSGDRRRA
ncbi:hypothetical protein [Niveibacterium sp.]|uniref:hypothetical protein n=1 Tax=Niveibacterium sp. TaxID=2017444 RepID=UPI0035B0D0D4